MEIFKIEEACTSAPECCCCTVATVSDDVAAAFSYPHCKWGKISIIRYQHEYTRSTSTHKIHSFNCHAHIDRIFARERSELMPHLKSMPLDRVSPCSYRRRTPQVESPYERISIFYKFGKQATHRCWRYIVTVNKDCE
nr:hypothetical protein [Chelativorans sp. ZYF759]